MVKRQGAGQNAYAAAGGIAQEALSDIKTITSLGVQSFMKRRYDYQLAKAEREGISLSLYGGVSLGFIFFTMFATYSLGFWYGAILISDKTFDTSQFLAVFFA
jgi:ATP-binding cassette, subfamily B (MDR/TAP), member 1